MTKIILDEDFHKGLFTGAEMVQTTFNGQDVTIPIDQYRDDASYGYEYQAFFHPIN